MGQAKQRGNFDQRCAASVIKRREQERLRSEALAAQEAMRTPAERDRSHRAAMLLTSVLGIVIASSSTEGHAIARMAAEYADE